jgi:hypothetical protein
LEQLQKLQQLQAQHAQVQVQVAAHKQTQLRQQVQHLPPGTQLSGQPQVLQIRTTPQTLVPQPSTAIQMPGGLTTTTLQPQLTTATLRSLGINIATPTFTPATSATPISAGTTAFNDDVIKAQAKQIEELQRQLQESQIKLQLQILQQQHLLLQQQQQQQLQGQTLQGQTLQGQPLLQVQLPQSSVHTSPQSLLTTTVSFTFHLA